MDRKSRALRNRLFVLAFCVLTVFCWCPLGYGTYGETGRLVGVPSWAAIAFLFGIGLFVLEWIYLFRTGLAVADEDLTETVSALEAVDTDAGEEVA